MTTRWTLTFDCHDVSAMARFWTLALGYVDAPPPEGWATWEEWLRHFDVPEDEWADGTLLEDPAKVLPSVGFLKVPEPKTAKNRLHLDLQVTGGRHVDQARRVELIESFADGLVEAGGTIAYRSIEAGQLDHITMSDPEGNEFCLV